MHALQHERDRTSIRLITATGLCLDHASLYIAWTDGLQHRSVQYFIREENLFMFI